MEYHPMPDDASSKAQPGDLSKEHYAAIGRVAVEWSDLEFMIDIATLRLAKIKHQMGVCLTAQIAGSGRKLDAYMSLAQFRGPRKQSPPCTRLRKISQGSQNSVIGLFMIHGQA
jgi:hypothetical protein